MDQCLPLESIIDGSVTAIAKHRPYVGVRSDSHCIRMQHGDIFEKPYDAIVNPANVSLMRGGGLCGVIHKRAGPKLEKACMEYGPQKVGNVVATPSYQLEPIQYVFHACGPRWLDGTRGEPSQLAGTYRNIISLAKEKGLDSIAIPAISTGIYGYPFAQASEIAIETVYPLLGDAKMRVLFVFPERERYEEFCQIAYYYLKSINAI